MRALVWNLVKRVLFNHDSFIQELQVIDGVESGRRDCFEKGKVGDELSKGYQSVGVGPDIKEGIWNSNKFE